MMNQDVKRSPVVIIASATMSLTQYKHLNVCMEA